MISSILIQATFSFTLFKFLLGSVNVNCLSQESSKSHSLHRSHRYQHRQNRPRLLKSSQKYLSPSSDYAKDTGKGKGYHLVFESMGKNFFDEWDFFSDADPTHGMVDYQTSEAAWKSGLVFSNPSSVDKNFTSAVMKVDDHTFLSDGQNRKSVRISSKKSFKYGLVILDVIKMPYGCSTWPAFWTVGNNWPQGGEIDILEGVNLNPNNQMTIHSVSQCNIKKQMSMNATGKVLTTNCDVYATGNIGCGVQDTSLTSFGEGLNNQSGGVFVMEWKESGISIWRFNRSQIPEELVKGQNPKPSTWSAPPLAHWDNDECHRLSDGFSEHKIVFDTTLCGDWAGASGVYNANGLCSGSCSDAVKDPSNFKNAFWEVASVKLYQSNRTYL